MNSQQLWSCLHNEDMTITVDHSVSKLIAYFKINLKLILGVFSNY